LTPIEVCHRAATEEKIIFRNTVQVLMPFPSQRNIELPLLKVLADAGGKLPVPEAIQGVTKYFPGITPEELASELDSGGNRWLNRVRWVRQNLVRDGELAAPAKGIWEITNRGLQRLKADWSSWKPKYVEELSIDAEERGQIEPRSQADPREVLETARHAVIGSVKEELLAKTRDLSPPVFEGLIKRMLERIGYSNVKVTGRKGDEGIDGECSTDRLGIVKVCFQAKRWQNVVGPGEIRDFVGALSIRRVAQGIFVTTATFSSEAVRAAEKAGNVKLVDGILLTELMVEAGLGVMKKALDVPTVDQDFFEGVV